MPYNRRALLAAGVGFTTLSLSGRTLAGDAKERVTGKPLQEAFRDIGTRIAADSKADGVQDHTAMLQALIDEAAAAGRTVVLPEGTLRVSDLRLRPGTCLMGQGRRTVLSFIGGAAFITADKADDVSLSGITFDGNYKTVTPERGEGLVNLAHARSITLNDIAIRNTPKVACH